jgi:hypothetical protein
MAYTTLADLKEYLGIDEEADDDDSLLEALIGRAQAYIETDTKCLFEPVEETRLFNTPMVSRLLILDKTLLTVTEILNGDGEVISEDDIILYPPNETAKWAIKLKDSSHTVTWKLKDGYAEQAISVEGGWGDFAEPPEDIVHGCTRLAAFYYRQKDAQVFDTTAMPEAGVITIPQGIPKDVKMILDKYRKPAL